MPVHMKDGKWYWGSQGPFDDKEEAAAVGRAAYAHGYDEGTARTVDQNGFVTVDGNPISMEGVFDYLGKNIPGYSGDPFDIVPVYRPAEELSHPDCLESFKLMPFINDHTWLGDEGTDPGQLPMQGMTGEQVYFDAPYLRANIRWFSHSMKQAIEDGKIELSPAYTWDVEETSGVFEGKPYKYIQRNPRGNHLALVDKGRTGRSVAVMDSDDTGVKSMTLEELIAALGQLDDAQLAAVLAALKVTKEGDQPTEEAPAEEVMEDAPAADEDPAAAEDMEEEDKAGQAMDAAIKRIEALERKNAELQAKAMDASAIMAAIAKRNELGSKLTKHVGAFAMDSMSLEQVAAYGCKKFGLKVAKGQEVTAVESYLAAAQAVRPVAFAQDSGAVKSAVRDAINDL